MYVCAQAYVYCVDSPENVATLGSLAVFSLFQPAGNAPHNSDLQMETSAKPLSLGHAGLWLSSTGQITCVKL